jgi:hypothetical protein
MHVWHVAMPRLNTCVAGGNYVPFFVLITTGE